MYNTYGLSTFTHASTFGLDPVKIWHFHRQPFIKSIFYMAMAQQSQTLCDDDPATFQQSSGSRPVIIRRLAKHHWRSPGSQWPLDLQIFFLMHQFQTHTEWRRQADWLTHTRTILILHTNLTHCINLQVCVLWLFLMKFILHTHSCVDIKALLFTHTSQCTWGLGPLSFICLNCSLLREDKSICQLYKDTNFRTSFTSSHSFKTSLESKQNLI